MPKSSQTSLTRFLAESGADTRERFYRTIALLALHIPQTENKVLRSRSVGHRGHFPVGGGGHPRTPEKAVTQPYDLRKSGKARQTVNDGSTLTDEVTL